MKFVESDAFLESKIDDNILEFIETIGRTCYKSHKKITKDSSEKLIKKIIDNGHESVLEHYTISVRVICSRACSHQIIRHRLASYSQESQRFVNYEKEGELTFIKQNSDIDINSILQDIENKYNKLIGQGVKPEDARTILPNCTKTELVMTMNLRQWRHFFKLRCSKHAQEEIRNIANKILKMFKMHIDILFDENFGDD